VTWLVYDDGGLPQVAIHVVPEAPPGIRFVNPTPDGGWEPTKVLTPGRTHWQYLNEKPYRLDEIRGWLCFENSGPIGVFNLDDAGGQQRFGIAFTHATILGGTSARLNHKNRSGSCITSPAGS
jgi:hypothetical protein